MKLSRTGQSLRVKRLLKLILVRLHLVSPGIDPVLAERGLYGAGLADKVFGPCFVA
jgi:hypothetical protein